MNGNCVTRNRDTALLAVLRKAVSTYERTFAASLAATTVPSTTINAGADYPGKSHLPVTTDHKKRSGNLGELPLL